MKFVGVQLSYFLRDPETKRNVRALAKYVAFVALVICLFAVVFHEIMLRYEGEEHSWITGFYWTLTVMSTLGFGDITFESDAGRLFSIVVLLSGIVLLLIVLPFAFIRFFYAPWLEAQIRQRAPRRVPAALRGHVVIVAYDTIARGLVQRLERDETPYVVLEEDAEVAASRHMDGLNVVTGEVDSTKTYERLNLDQARLLVVNREDTVNTNVVLTVRAVAPDVPIVAIANEDDSVDVLELSGADHVLPIKRWLGEQLANRVSALRARSQEIGQIEDLHIAELPLHHTPLAGKTVRETHLRQLSGVSIVGVWERGHLLPARPDVMLDDTSVLVVVGTTEQLEALDDLLMIYNMNPHPVVVVGGGRVGRATARALAAREIPVHLVEREEHLCRRLEGTCERVFTGNAADYELLAAAGIHHAPSVVLTTNDDAMNVYLASYCRKLNPDLRIVSRITHERNLEAIHRAGADFVLSYASLGAQAVFSLLSDRELVVLGEDVDLFTVPVPRKLAGKALGKTEIGARTGLSVLAVRENGTVTTSLTATTVLPPGAELMMLGDTAQRRDFVAAFGR